MKMTNTTRKQNVESLQHQLQVEQLEDRQMLSTVTVYAQGSTGEESMQLLVDDVVVETWTVPTGNPFTGGVSAFSANIDGDVSIEQIKVQFINDFYDPANGVDRNLRVDRVSIDATTYETENGNVFSTGTWLPQDGITPGFGRGETLHTNGYFQFGGITGSGSLIEINGYVQDGPASFEVLIDGNVAATFQAGDQPSTYQFQADQSVTADQVRIQFSEDRYDPANGIDVNLVIDNIVIDGNTFETEDQSVFSTGTWVDGLAPGFGRGDTLHTNGYFQYSSNLEIERLEVIDTISGDVGLIANDPFSDKYAGVAQLSGGDVQVELFRADGTRDTSFGGDGKVSLQQFNPAIGPEISITSLSFFPDGSLLVVGRNFNFVGTSLPYLLKLRADGSLDTSFAANGLLSETNLGIENSDTGFFEAVVDPSGKFAVVGNVWNSDSSYHVRFFDAQGNLDTTRGFNGDITIYPNFGNTDLVGVVDNHDGSFFLIYNRSNFQASNFVETSVLKFNANGLLDDTFGTDGVGLTRITPQSEFRSYSSFDVDHDGRLVLAGDSEIVRLSVSGELDDAFGTFGRFVYADSGYVDNNGERVRFQRFQGFVIDSLNRLVLVSENTTRTGKISTNNDPSTIVRVTESGGFDNSFDENGIQVIPFSAKSEPVLDDDGNLLLSLTEPGPRTFPGGYQLTRLRIN